MCRNLHNFHITIFTINYVDDEVNYKIGVVNKYSDTEVNHGAKYGVTI